MLWCIGEKKVDRLDTVDSGSPPTIYARDGIVADAKPAPFYLH